MSNIVIDTQKLSSSKVIEFGNPFPTPERLPGNEGIKIVSVVGGYAIFDGEDLKMIIPKEALAQIYEQSKTWLILNRNPIVNDVVPAALRAPSAFDSEAKE